MIQAIINRKTISLPTSRAEITLGDAIDFYNAYGRGLDENLEKIRAIDDEDEQAILLGDHLIEKMCATFAFFSGCTVDAVRDCAQLDVIGDIYGRSLHSLFHEDHEQVLKTTFTWNGDTWCLPQPELGQSSPVTFGEFIDCRQRMQDMAEASKWERLQFICAIFLRKKNMTVNAQGELEEYHERFPQPGSERMELMRRLPMDIAMAVAFFLNCSLTSLPIISPSSGRRALRWVAASVRSISSSGGGSIF